MLLCYGFFSLPTNRKSSIHLVSFATRGMFRSLTSLKINIQRSLAQDGECGLASSSRLPSLSKKDIMLARRGVPAPWTRFQMVCLCVGEKQARSGLRGHRSHCDACILFTFCAFLAVTKHLLYYSYTIAVFFMFFTSFLSTRRETYKSK